MELAESVSFERFEAFDKGKHLAAWKVELGEIYYVQGKIQKAKSILESALADMGADIKGENPKKVLNDLVKKHAWTVFKGKDKGEIDKKWDTTGNTDIKCKARLLIIAVLELDEDRVVEVSERSE